MDSTLQPGSLRSLASQGLPLILPWSKKYIPLGAAFDSSCLQYNIEPWVARTAFKSTSLELRREMDQTDASYREALSSAGSQSAEHLSASLGVTVGNDFLNANVTGGYDENVMNSSNSTKASRNGTYRAGRVTLDSEPQLTSSAKELLAESPQNFKQHHGDYYLAGYQLGADAGYCLALSSSASMEQKELHVEVSVKVLLWEAKRSWSDVDRKVTSDLSMVFCGFDTLEQTNVKDNCAAGDFEKLGRIGQMSTEYTERVTGLQSRINKSLKMLGMDHSSEVSPADCQKLCEAGLVVRLILLPYSSLRAYKEIFDL